MLTAPSLSEARRAAAEEAEEPAVEGKEEKRGARILGWEREEG